LVYAQFITYYIDRFVHVKNVNVVVNWHVWIPWYMLRCIGKARNMAMIY